MAIKFQYNKTSLQNLEKQLKIREQALPILQNKETALRIEVKKAKDQAEALALAIEKQVQQYQHLMALWSEFDTSLVSIQEVQQNTRKIAGAKIPVLQDIKLQVKEFNMFNQPAWFLDGVSLIKEFTMLSIRRTFALKAAEILDQARKKTTQKVNLYEKVQIPGYQLAIRKIKRALEDEENLSKAAQKIVKTRLARIKEESL